MTGGQRILIAGLAIMVAAVCFSPASAAGLRNIDNSSAQEVVDGMANKLSRGVANTATGWLELPKQVYVTWQESGPTKGILLGPLKGVGMTVVRTLSGVGELATFFVAWPGFYDPYLDPPYVWEKE
ncbi:exosortase system-associated protein, TIGR04073 family [Geobacter sp.]|uniref:exosortase system-associated protein, TIGR04073 family n=1 Tax=Geobacter sp. TaxID=46610 RepID=UPI00261862B1|nr:exosortase system-associated protein, TIGR04073 family [Geobacter sp.]